MTTRKVLGTMARAMLIGLVSVTSGCAGSGSGVAEAPSASGDETPPVAAKAPSGGRPAADEAKK